MAEDGGAAERPPRLPDVRPGLGQVLARGLGLRCPRCGRTRLFEGWFRMHERCASCGLRYEREQGYFVGAIYVNYAVTVGLGLGGVLLLDTIVDLPLAAELGIALAVVTLVPPLFFRYSRGLWLAIDYFVTAADERSQRGPHGR